MSAPSGQTVGPRHLRATAPPPPTSEPPAPTRRWMTAYVSLLVVIAVAATGLAYVGVHTVRESRDGRAVSSITDPALPGFEALLAPTPTLAILHGEGDELVSAALVSLNSGDVGGSVVIVPPATKTSLTSDAVSVAYATQVGPSDTLRDAVPPLQGVLGIGIAESVVVDDARWAELVAPVAPLSLDNPDAVGSFEAGPIALEAVDVGTYLTATRDGESAMARAFRQQVFFEAWAGAVAAVDDPATAVPGEVDSGIGRFVRGLAAGPHTVSTLPLRESDLITGDTRVDVDQVAWDALLPTLVPFPTASSPGRRVRVRVLDGTGDPDHVLMIAPRLIPAAAEVVVVGNADAFDYQETQIRFHIPEVQAAAKAFQEALGTGRVVDDPRQTDAFDVTIVLGTDL